MKKPAPKPHPKPETKKHAADVAHLAEMLHDDAVKRSPGMMGPIDVVFIPPTLCLACGNPKIDVCAACGN